MMLDTPRVFFFAVVAVGLLIGAAFLLWRRHTSVVTRMRAECERLEALSEARERWYKEANERAQQVEGELALALEGLSRSKAQIDQLRDLIKIHVARRREFDEWASPIKAHLGEGVGHVLHTLKDSLARQEFALRRQERIVAEAQDQYRAKRDELERMRRELTLKNYHIATLNERFIRIEERMQELGAEVKGRGGSLDEAARARPGAEITGVHEGVPEPVAKKMPDTETFLADDAKSKDWMGVLEDWHRQLQDRFERLEELQTRIRGGSSSSGSTATPRTDRAGGG